MSEKPLTETTDQTHAGAVSVAAKATGLRSDQISRAIQAYRTAIDDIEDEPDWQAIMHMSSPRKAIAQYGAEGTAVTLQINSWKEREQWHEDRSYVLRGEMFKHFAEARQAELASQMRPKPYEVKCADKE